MNIEKYIAENCATMSDTEMGIELGLTKGQVRHRRAKLVNKKTAVVTIEEEVLADRTIRKLTEDKSHTAKKNKHLQDRVDSLEEELESAIAIKNAVKSYKISIPKKSKGSEAVAVWLASDWHVAEKVTRGQTNGLNEYNLEIAKSRAEAYFRNGLRLTDMSAKETSVDTIVLALLGDFITGHLHQQAVETNYLAPVEEAIFAQNLIVAGIEYILANSKYDLIIPCHSGNHGRTTRFAEFGSENGHSHEYFMYCSIANHFRNEKRVKVTISEGAHSYLDVFGYKVRFLHGHDVKFGGGVGGITIPLNKAISQWDKACPADITCLGHFHQRLDGGSFMVNGSLIGYNSFALSIKASAEKPVQQFFLIDKDYGKTVVCPILLDK